MKLLTLTALCATLVFSCSQNRFEQSPVSERIVQTTSTKQVINTSKVIDFQIVGTQELSTRGLISVQDFIKNNPQYSERTKLLASVDEILETSTGHWEFYSNFKLLFTLVSPDRQDMQTIAGQEHLFNTITLHTNFETKLTDAIRFNISDCQYASAAMCDRVDGIIYVHTLNGTPRLDQDQSQDKDQDKDQDN